MTPEIMRNVLNRQTPEQQKTMLFATKFPRGALEAFKSGRGDLTPEQAGCLLDWLSGRYVMTSSQTGYVRLPDKPKEPNGKMLMLSTPDPDFYRFKPGQTAGPMIPVAKPRKELAAKKKDKKWQARNPEPLPRIW